MNYEEATEYLFTRHASFHEKGAGAYKPGLGTTLTLSSLFGNPHTSFPTIHIAGTNGKGSTAHTIASILMEAGLRVGLYTSPHLLDFTERIKINSQSISKQAVTEFVNYFASLKSIGVNPSFFEITTIMAFKYFADQNVDVAVIETGLGGALDSTNIITPILSIITNVTYDHTDLLGDTFQEIASQKAGIIKEYVPVIIGRRNPQTDNVFIKGARDNDIIFSSDNKLYSHYEENNEEYIYYNTPWGDVTSPLTGHCQPENMAVILNAIKLIERQGLCSINASDVLNGIKKVIINTSLKGRWTTISKSPLTIIDTAHNIDAFRLLIPNFEKLTQNGKHIFSILGFVSDKDYEGILAMLSHIKNLKVFITQPKVQRAAPANDVFNVATKRGMNAELCVEIEQAYDMVMEQIKNTSDNMIFVGGSNYLVSDFLKYIGQI